MGAFLSNPQDPETSQGNSDALKAEVRPFCSSSSSNSQYKYHSPAHRTPFSPLELPEAKIKQPKPMLNAGRQTSALNRNQIKQAPTNPQKEISEDRNEHFFLSSIFFSSLSPKNEEERDWEPEEKTCLSLHKDPEV